jgi:hypothetical protein
MAHPLQRDIQVTSINIDCKIKTDFEIVLIGGEGSNNARSDAASCSEEERR